MLGEIVIFDKYPQLEMNLSRIIFLYPFLGFQREKNMDISQNNILKTHKISSLILWREVDFKTLQVLFGQYASIAAFWPIADL